MSWTEITRAQYRRDGLTCASDLNDAEWLLLSFFLPAASHVGRPREVDLRHVVNAILYVLSTGCQWRALPRVFPPRSTVQYYFYLWRDQRLWRRINLALVRRARNAMGRDGVPTAGVIDSQSVKTTESGGPRGFDAAKKVRGRKRHLVTDTQGLRLRCWCIPPTFRTTMARCRCSPRCGGPSPDCAMLSPTASTAARSCARRSRRSAAGASRSSPDPSGPAPSNRSQHAG